MQGGSSSSLGRVLHDSTFAWHAVALPWHHPWHSHGISWRGVGFHGTPWGGAWHAMGRTAASPPTALRGNPTACHGDPGPRHLGLGFHGMPWRPVECCVVFHGRVSAGGATAMPSGMPRKKDNDETGHNVHYCPFSRHAAWVVGCRAKVKHSCAFACDLYSLFTLQ